MTKFTRFALVAALLAAPAVSQAQITGSIGASADIATVFAFSTVVPLNFGAITPGQSATGTGSILLSRNVGVIFTLPDAATTGQLKSPAGLTVQPTYSCGVGSTGAAIVTAFSSCAPLTGTTSVLTEAAPTTVTKEYVIFSGTLAATQTDIAPATYSGTIRITATQN